MKIYPNKNINNETSINFSSPKITTTSNANTIFTKSETSKPEDVMQTWVILENNKITPKGSNNPEHLKNAPSPEIEIAGEKKFAAIVVDIEHNLLYTYNEKGEAEMVYSVATGKKRTPTRKGIKMITNVEDYPYKTAYGTKRKKNPDDYGPNVIIIENINPETGKIYGNNGQFIHGNNNEKSLGEYASLGCVRMDNEVIKKLAKEVVKQTYVLVK